MKYSDLIKLIEKIAPNEIYKDIDNSGEQIYVGKEDIKTVLVCLEINDEVLLEAVKKCAGMIITHHPLIFNPQYVIDYNDYPGKYILDAVKNNISVYSAHLSFDFAARGNNYYIAHVLKINEYQGGSMNDGYYGELPNDMTIEEACEHVKKSLDLPPNYISCVDGGKEKLRKVGFCTGAGGDYIFKAAKNGCDLFITGDLRLHEAQYAKAMGMSVIDAGHYGTEKIFAENMAKQLTDIAEKTKLDLDVIISEANTNPYTL